MEKIMAMMRGYTRRHGRPRCRRLRRLPGLPAREETGRHRDHRLLHGRSAVALAAGVLGGRIAAAASFHGGNIAKEDDPDSPHHKADAIKATVYVAGAIEDQSFPEEQKDRLEKALSDAGVAHTIETYPAHHGFAVPDNASYDEAAAERHWQAMDDLFASLP